MLNVPGLFTSSRSVPFTPLIPFHYSKILDLAVDYGAWHLADIHVLLV